MYYYIKIFCFFLVPGVARSMATFGEGTGSILMDDLQCTGNETDITSCTHTSNHNCGHSEDAGVLCSRELKSRIDD